MSTPKVLLATLLTLALVPAVTVAQVLPCGTSGGTNCRTLIKDRDGLGNTADPVYVESVIPVTAVGTCTTQPVLAVSATVNVLHDWVHEVGISLTNPGGTTATLRTGTLMSGQYVYPNEDLHQTYTATSLIGGSSAGNWTLRLNDVSRSGYGALDDWTLTIVCAQVPVITVTAPVPTAIEVPLISGSFRVSRSEVTPFPVDVTLTVGGTAGAGDYVPIPLTVTIPANQAYVDILVTPVPDGIVEPGETVVVTISDSLIYTVGSPSSATVTILDFQPQIPALGAVGLAGLLALVALVGAWALRRQ